MSFIRAVVEAFRRLPPLRPSCFPHANDMRQRPTYQINGYPEVWLLRIHELLLWQVFVTVVGVWRAHCAIPPLCARSHCLRGRGARRPAIMSRGKRWRAATRQPAAPVIDRHRNVAGGYCGLADEGGTYNMAFYCCCAAAAGSSSGIA